MPTIYASATQVRAFRAQRGWLTDERAPDAMSAAHRLLGTQAQVITCGLHALAMRTQGNPTLNELKLGLEQQRSLVRTWGQRDTLHIYTPQDLSLIIGCRLNWKKTGRRDGAPSEEVLSDMEALFFESSTPLTRTEIIPHLPASYTTSLTELAARAGMTTERIGASRVIEFLAARGTIVFAAKKGREQSYAHREHWFDALPWDIQSPDESCQEATRRYLHAFGPVSLDDMAYHMGAKKSDVKRWTADMSAELIDVHCDGFKPMLLLEHDHDALLNAQGPLPLRLLPAYDTVLMGHKNKAWLLHDEKDYGHVWKRAAVVAAVILRDGQIVGTWSQKKRAKRVNITLHPLGGWDPSMLEDAQKEALRYAQHLEVSLDDVCLDQT